MAYRLNIFTGQLDLVNPSGGSGGGVQSVTGLNTDNTDPENPVVEISVDGITITGSGTPGDPLVAVPGGTGLQMESPSSGNVDGANSIFEFDHEPTFIVSDGMTRVLVDNITDINGNGYTVSGSTPYTITVSDLTAPVSFIRSFFNP